MSALRLPVVGDHVRPDLCAPCGGKCCQAAPGISIPEDFGAPDVDAMRPRVLAALASGRWAIDWWEGDPRETEAERRARVEREEDPAIGRGYYLRPAIKGHEHEVFHPAYGGGCTFHGPDGCSAFETRPRGCRDLIPGVEKCNTAIGDPKRHGAIAWVPFSVLLERLGDEARS